MVNMAVSCPHTFPLGSHNYYFLPLMTRGLISHALELLLLLLLILFLLLFLLLILLLLLLFFKRKRFY